MARTQEPLFTLRVLTELDETYGVYVSRCLETGHVVTADDKTTASSMMQELLQDEITYAVEQQNFPNLFSSPASPDVFSRWITLARKKKIDTQTLTIDAKEMRLDDEQEVPTEIRFAAA